MGGNRRCRASKRRTRAKPAHYTKQVPLEMRVKGFLLHDAEKGREDDTVTLSGRTVRGTLTGINPEYAHMFGRPIPELSPIAGEIWTILRERRKTS